MNNKSPSQKQKEEVWKNKAKNNNNKTAPDVKFWNKIHKYENSIKQYEEKKDFDTAFYNYCKHTKNKRQENGDDSCREYYNERRNYNNWIKNYNLLMEKYNFNITIEGKFPKGCNTNKNKHAQIKEETEEFKKSKKNKERSKTKL